ncbi:sacsin N-terminal ATP-binding-like domain-containing protein [Kitasatospora azatica]|uniref:sacsin N-terminal ATP-binding-like domain-containing protein n=1 Tax=Kitasatospora azatica TaxID=58347 RepID=UPI000A010729|nr:molecular chaperone Hsp90 [Kitasatospora azatica]
MEPRIIGGGSDEQGDRFETAELRRRVLDAWGASPARFREDANAEEELALGGYRDRLIVELAQNAADAAARAGHGPGRLRLTLRDGVLAAANTGAPLDAAAVESLATLRASSKRADAGPTVGRFGVGFAAVLAVSDEPAIVGHAGGVRWSLAEARELTSRQAAERSQLADELVRREGHVPLLRLPFPAEGEPPAGYDTVVLLPLRDGAAQDLTRRLLEGIDDALLLTLPGLAELVVETPDGRVRTLTRSAVERTEDGLGEVLLTDRDADRDSQSRWQTVTATGALAPELLTDRPVEERARPYWTVTWAVPVSATGTPEPVPVAPVLHAPTPSEEPLGVPALLIASYPLDSTRRHIAPGPLTDYLTERAAEAYTDLLRARGADLGSLALVPAPLGQGALDNALRGAILSRLPGTAFLPHPAPVEEGTPALRPKDATLVEGANREVVEALAPIFPGLLPAGLERRAELRALQVRRLPLAEVVDQLGGLEREPAWWRSLYGALAGADPEALGALPVPLATGRVVTGPRRVLLPSDDADWAGFPGYPEALAEALDLLDLRLAHPEAAHPLLAKLGATVATPAGVLQTPELRAAVARSLDVGDEDFDAAADLADAVLGLVKAAEAKAGDHPWLARLALPDDEGELSRAGELILPDSPFAQLARPEDAPYVDEDLLERWGPEVLAAAGVLSDFVLVRAEDAVLDPDDLERLDPTAPADRAVGGSPTGLLDEAPDGLADWCEEALEALHADDADDLGVPPVAAELLVVRDLDLVDDQAWPEALARLARPPYRDAVVTPVRALLPDGSYTDLPPYTAWWLRDHPVLDGREPAGLRAAGADPLLRGLYDEARTTLDPEFLHALGVRTTLAALLAEPHGSEELLDRLTDPVSEVTHRQLHGIYTALAQVDAEPIDVVRAVPPLDEETGRRPGHTVVVDATEAVVADAPDLVQLLHPYPLVPVAPALAPALAERLHVSLASEIAGGRVLSEGALHRVPPFVRELLPGCPAAYEEHEELLVVGPDGEEAAVDWRWDTSAPTPELPYDPDAADEADEDDEFEVPPVPGLLHAATPEGLAAGLAWSVGQWHRRFEVLAALAEPDRAYELSAARDFEG